MCHLFRYTVMVVTTVLVSRVSMSQQYFMKCHRPRLSDVQKTTISLLFELIRLRHKYL